MRYHVTRVIDIGTNRRLWLERKCLKCIPHILGINELTPGICGIHFKNVISKLMFCIDILVNLYEIGRKRMSQDPLYDQGVL